MSSVYRKGQALGWGCFATVFKGWDELLDRPVAIKELIQPFAGNDAFVRAYLGQALRMVDIAHPHVLATYAVEPNRKPAALTREAADETMGHQLVEGPIAPEAVLRILRHALAGLGVIHGRELLHRSIKPENLFVCGNLYKIGDFGIAPVEGMPPFPARQFKYTAPEALSGEEQIGPGADLYSLGLVIHELLVGSVRFERIVEETLRKSGGLCEEGEDEEEGGVDRLWPLFHLSPATVPPLHELETSIPVALSLTLQKMVAKNQADRYGSCREVLAALGAAGLVENLGGSQTLVLFPPSPAPAPLQQRGRNSLVLGSGVVTALLVAGAALVIGVRGREGTIPSGASPLTQEASEPSPSDGDASPIPQITDRAALAKWLRSLQGNEGGLSLALYPSRGEVRARLPLGTPFKFRVAADRTLHAALFVLSSDGSVACIYPGPTGSTLRLESGRGVLLPLPEDEVNGFTMTATEPIGRDLVFLLTSENPLPPLPSGEPSKWATSYSFVPGDPKSPAIRFADWVTGVRRDVGTGLSVYEVEVVEGS